MNSLEYLSVPFQLAQFEEQRAKGDSLPRFEAQVVDINCNVLKALGYGTKAGKTKGSQSCFAVLVDDGKQMNESSES